MELKDQVDRVCQECEIVGMALAKHGEKVRRRIALLRIVNVVASAAVFVSLIPSFAETIGVHGVRGLGVFAGAVLLLDTVLPLFVGQDSPARYEDYSKYIFQYRRCLEEAQADSRLPGETKLARQMELIRLANANLVDVKAKWPLVVAGH
jgi:hypothetical protein